MATKPETHVVPDAGPREYVGSIVGVDFGPSIHAVKIKTTAGTRRLIANAEVVDTAFFLRGEVVRALAVEDGKRLRLVHLRKADEKPSLPSDEAVDKYIYTRWDEVFAALAK